MDGNGNALECCWFSGARGGRGVRETEYMNVCGCAANRRARMVDLPAPEGPDMTIGREGGMVVVGGGLF